MAHPDDEYALAATTYRVTREIGGVADHVVVANGEGGYRYALAETVYGAAIARESDGRASLPAIRKPEAIRAGPLSWEWKRAGRRRTPIPSRACQATRLPSTVEPDLIFFF